MAETKDGGPAFSAPVYTKNADRDTDDRGYTISEEVTYTPEVVGGLTIRDWFAGQAMVGYLSGSEHEWAHRGAIAFGHEVAEAAYDIADAMLAERAKAEGTQGK